ncbi:MAG: hypothetical protein ACYCUM_13090 [Solirubrobacteraceae bacterium]
MSEGVRSLRPSRSHLRLVHDANRSILIAGGDAARRQTLMRELARRMPPGTSFDEAVATWEVLERAPSSRLLMLAGELDDGSSESVMHLVGKRHPSLPIVTLSEPAATTA